MTTVTRVLSILVAFLSVVAVGIPLAQAKSGNTNDMQAVLVTYENDASAVQVKSNPDVAGFAKALKKVPGLISKTWINDGKTFGGFYVFTDKVSAAAFINGDMFQNAVVKDPSNRNVQIRYLAVFSELTVASGGSSKLLSGQ